MLQLLLPLFVLQNSEPISRNNSSKLSCTDAPLTFPTNVQDSDREMILDQLGYVPENLVSVSARRGTGSPLALKTYSLNGGGARRKRKALGDMTPFPTLYWFCCPIVSKAISDLEREGYVRILEDRLEEDESILANFIKSHEGYALERWNSLLPQHQEYLQKSDRMTEMVKYSGIAGTDFKSFAPNNDNHDRDRASIKCLRKFLEISRN